MDWAQNSASNKIPRDVSEKSKVSGDFDSGVVIPIQLSTLKIISALFKEGPKSTSIEEALKMDPLLSGFMDHNFDRGTELLKDHFTIFRGSSDKLTGNKRLKIGVGEDATDFSDGNKGKTKVDETTSVDMHQESVDMHQESDEAEATFGNLTDVDEMDDDEAEEDETDEQMDKEEEYDKNRRAEHFRIWGPFKDKTEDVPDTRSLIEKVMDDPFIEFLAERISNYEDLMEVSDKMLENLRKDDVSIAQHEKLVSQFWENEHFRKGLCEELLENVSLFGSMVNFARMVVVEEESHEKVDRIKMDRAVEKILDEKDRVVRMRGILGIIIGYWIKKDMLIARANEMYASDAVPKQLKYNLGLWSRLR